MNEPEKIGGLLLNRLIVGILVIVLWAFATGISAYVLSIPFTTDLGIFASGINNFWSWEGFGVIVFWVASSLVLAVIGIVVVRHRKHFQIYKGEKDKDDIPNKITIVYLIIVGGLITALMWIFRSIINGINDKILTTDLVSVFNAVRNGEFIPIISFALGAILVGVIVVAVVGSGKVEKLADDLDIKKI